MVFAITNAREYRKKVESDLNAFLAAIDDSSAAINAVTSTFHLSDWLWAHQIKPATPFALEGVTIKRKPDFLNWLDGKCPHFRLIQNLTNGSKHAFPVHSGGKIEGYGQGPFGIGPFNASYLLIDLGSGTNDRYIVASEIIREAADYMIKLSKRLGA